MNYKLTCKLEECSEEELYKYEEETKYSADDGLHHCVTFVQKTTKIPKTTSWKKGVRIKDTKQGEIPKGTVIATFDDAGKYPTDGLGKHAAIYLTHTNDYIIVYDQWKEQGKVKKREIRFNRSATTKRSDNGDTFYVVEVDS